jgi:hypothetical protein
MYLREALRRCAELEERTQSIYEELASQHASAAHLADAWRDLAADGHMRARQLTALAAIHEAVNDDGPFVVGLQRRIDAAAFFIDAAAADAREGPTPPRALELASELESSELRRLFQELRDLARAGVRKLTDKLYRGTGAARARCRLDRVERAIGDHRGSADSTPAACGGADPSTSAVRTNASSERQ